MRRFAVLGHPINHSFSPVMHMASFRSIGFDGEYTRLDVPPEMLGDALKADDGSGNLYVYDNRGGRYCFYSYANVLVTMHGKFENVAAETSTVDVEITVEPNFEHANEGLGVDTSFDGEHHYQIK